MFTERLCIMNITTYNRGENPYIAFYVIIKKILDNEISWISQMCRTYILYVKSKT